MTISSEVEIIQMPELKFVGIPVTSVFANHEPERIERAKQAFMERTEEIKRIAKASEYVCLSFVSETLFTYLICIEVTELKEVPNDMIGFIVPAHKYGKARSDGDTYSVIHQYLKEQGLKNNKRALAMEIYKFEDPQWPNKVDVYIPIEE
ncbi:GyrI-like domain-containing protein [Cohnella lupini]|uniref:Putative transcriptional regulator YdeE n=1 Tax=Cohnella lupini TaxID=1294267 RepID=A0A3D9IWR1_9BACL|nr:GyrI-like domain-containing protein [Cohnella lupini]RED66145.1 putative transcriptional regulator YdeE [Cohnella lupini]